MEMPTPAAMASRAATPMVPSRFIHSFQQGATAVAHHWGLDLSPCTIRNAIWKRFPLGCFCDFARPGRADSASLFREINPPIAEAVEPAKCHYG